MLRRASDDADVIVIDSLIAAAFAGRMDCAAVPVVGLVHQRIGGARWSERRFALDLRAYRDMAALIAAGPMVAAELDRFGLHDTEVVIPGTDPPPALDDPPALRHGRSIAIVCVANWLPSKGIAELLTACRELPMSMATVHLVGDPRATTRYGRVVARLARTPALRRRVVVHGALEPDAVAPLLAGADVFALPSLQETYGMAWAEALAAGLPIVGWDASNLPNLVTDGVEGILARPRQHRGAHRRARHPRDGREASPEAVCGRPETRGDVPDLERDGGAFRRRPARARRSVRGAVAGERPVVLPDADGGFTTADPFRNAVVDPSREDLHRHAGEPRRPDAIEVAVAHGRDRRVDRRLELDQIQRHAALVEPRCGDRHLEPVVVRVRLPLRPVVIGHHVHGAQLPDNADLVPPVHAWSRTTCIGPPSRPWAKISKASAARSTGNTSVGICPSGST